MFMKKNHSIIISLVVKYENLISLLVKVKYFSLDETNTISLKSMLNDCKIYPAKKCSAHLGFRVNSVLTRNGCI